MKATALRSEFTVRFTKNVEYNCVKLSIQEGNNIYDVVCPNIEECLQTLSDILLGRLEGE